LLLQISAENPDRRSPHIAAAVYIYGHAADLSHDARLDVAFIINKFYFISLSMVDRASNGL